MSAALGALEDEPACARLEELPQQSRRGHVQEGADPGPLQCLGLRGPPARDDRVAGPQLPYGFELGVSGLLGREAEHPDAPGAARQRGTGLRQHRARLRAAGEGQRDEGQSAAPGDGGGESRLVADPGHRPLRDGQFGAERPAHGRAGAQRPGRPFVAYRVPYGGGQGADHSGGVLPALGEAGGEETVLTHREQLGARVPRAEQPRHLGRVVGGDPRRVRAAAAQDAVAGHDRGLGAVHRPQRGGRRLREPRLGEQRQLAVHRDPGRAAGHGGRRRPWTDAAAGPDRESEPRCGEELLQQDEGAQFADPAAALPAPGDQTVGPGSDRRQGLFQIGDLHQHAVFTGDLVDLPGRVRAEDHGVRAATVPCPRCEVRGVDEVRGGQSAVPADPHPERPGLPAPDPCQRLSGSSVAGSEVEHPESAGPADGGGEPGVRFTKGSDSNDQVFGAHSRRHDSPHKR